MGRGKIKMELIRSDTARKTTYHKRKRGLMRKAYELSTLCDVETFVIISEPHQKCHNNNNKYAFSSKYETWPSNPNEVTRMISKYKSIGGAGSNLCKRIMIRKCYDLNDFFVERKRKVEAEICKVKKQVVEVKCPTWHECLDYMSEDQLSLFLGNIDSQLQLIKMRIGFIEDGNFEPKYDKSRFYGEFTGQNHCEYFMHRHMFDQGQIPDSKNMLHLELSALQNINPIQMVSRDIDLDCTKYLLTGPSSSNTTHDQYYTGLFNPLIFNDHLGGAMQENMMMFNDPSCSMGMINGESYFNIKHQGVISSGCPDQSSHHGDQVNELDFVFDFLKKNNKT